MLHLLKFLERTIFGGGLLDFNFKILPEEPMSEEEEEQEEVENSSASEYEDASDSESDGNDELSRKYVPS